jgi:purine-binding chemotaxis protein CheW
MANEISQYLTFSLYKEKYAVSVSNVREILEVIPITRVPGMPDYMKGVLNLRGSVVPVIDLRKKFSLPDAENTIDTSIIILEIINGEEIMLIGSLVDSVQEVINISAEEIEPAPTLGMSMKTGFITGMFQHDKDFLIILNINKVLSSDEITSLPKKTEITSKDN